MSTCSDNRKQVIAFAKEVKQKFPGKTIWAWSGYTFEELAADDATKEFLQYVDVLVDGPFVKEKHDASLAFRGSSNQRIFNVAAWRRDG